MELVKEKNFVSVVVYCYNDKAHIRQFILGLNEVLNDNFIKYEIIVVNDASTDDGIGILKELFSNEDTIADEKVLSVINMSYRQGLEQSMNAGVELAIGDFVFEFDTMQVNYDWEYLMKIYRHSLKGYDIVSASSKSKSKFASRLYYRVFNKYAHLQNKLETETFRILSRRAINRIHSITNTIPYRKAAYANCGLSIDNIKYTPTKTISSNKSDRWSVAVDSLILFTDVAFRATLALAILMITITLGMGVFAIVYKLTKAPVEGWTATVSFLSLAFSGLFVILAVIIKYLQTIVNMLFHKKNFLFESIEKI